MSAAGAAGVEFSRRADPELERGYSGPPRRRVDGVGAGRQDRQRRVGPKPGTGHVSIAGLNLAEFIEVAAVLREWPVVALDVVELNPNLDPTGRSSPGADR